MMSRSKEGSEKLDSWFDSDRYLDFFDGFDVDDYITMRTRSRNNVLTLSSPVATGPRSNVGIVTGVSSIPVLDSVEVAITMEGGDQHRTKRSKTNNNEPVLYSDDMDGPESLAESVRSLLNPGRTTRSTQASSPPPPALELISDSVPPAPPPPPPTLNEILPIPSIASTILPPSQTCEEFLRSNHLDQLFSSSPAIGSIIHSDDAFLVPALPFRLQTGECQEVGEVGDETMVDESGVFESEEIIRSIQFKAVAEPLHVTATRILTKAEEAALLLEQCEADAAFLVLENGDEEPEDVDQVDEEAELWAEFEDFDDDAALLLDNAGIMPKGVSIQNEESDSNRPAETFGFINGHGLRMKGSSANLAKAMALLAEEEEMDSPVESTSILSTSTPFRPHLQPLPFFGFTSGGGGAIAPLSDAAIARAARLLQSPPSAAPAVSTSSRPSFTSGAGNSVAPAPFKAPRPFIAPMSIESVGFSNGNGVRIVHSKEVLEKREWLFNASSPPDRVIGVFVKDTAEMEYVSRNLGEGTETDDTARLDVEPLSTVRRIPLLSMNPNLSRSALPSPLPSPSSPRKDPIVPIPHRRLAESTPIKTTFRPPLISTSKLTPRIGSTSTSKPLAPLMFKKSIGFRPPLIASTSKSTPAKLTPVVHRKLNLSMTPRARPKHSHKFSTPFKGGVHPVGLSVAGVVGWDSKGKGKEKEVVVKVENHVTLFNLTLPKDRLSMRQAGVKPQREFYEQLESQGLPVSLLQMDHVSASGFTFEDGRGEADALRALLDAGGSLATLRWVKNHWSLIMWKIASLVRSKPDLLPTYWNFDHVVDQLKYRYEREINQAQRSAIKRIQEQDSASTLPIVLCVSEICWADATVSGEGDQKMVIVGLVLTDGWYRIRANLDPTLKSACARGKIAVGAKLAITGARIESSQQGTEVLEALDSSSITISGNSTALTSWFAPLGFAQEIFIASLNSLTSDGGVAPLLDVVIERVFPYGYIDLDKNGSREMWNEAEERTKVEEWSKGRRKVQAKLADELEQSTDEWSGIIEILQEALQQSSAVKSEEEEDSDELLDRLQESSNKQSIIRNLSSHQIQEALKLAAEYSTRSRHQAIGELEKELTDSFPPRDVRGFRMLRVKDAQQGNRTLSMRTALLTVWDANSLGTDFFVAGNRYLVSNVIPKGSWKRSSGEVTLATRRDSRWSSKETP